MIIAGFQVQDKFRKARFFQETFLLADTSIEVVFGMLFLALSKVKVDFTEKELTWKAYTIAKVLPTTKRVQIICLKEFAKVALDPKQKAFVVHVATFFQINEGAFRPRSPDCRLDCWQSFSYHIDGIFGFQGRVF